MTRIPEFFELSAAECEALLQRNHIGRLAFRRAERVDIAPISYVARDGWLFLRSAYGARLEAITRDPFVAFEVDEIEGPFEWRSVVAYGTVYLLPLDGSPIEQREARRAVEALRSIMPDAFSSKDPVPERQIIYGLHITELSGRMAGIRDMPGRRKVRPRSAPKRRRPADQF